MLQEVALIASEDTRNTQKLLNHFEIHTPQKSLHEHNYKERIPQFLEVLKNGKSIAQVSDAGMPSISDPGHEFVVACIEEDIPCCCLARRNSRHDSTDCFWPTAATISILWIFTKKEKEQENTLEKLKNHTATLIFYESPYRVVGL